MLDGAYRKAHKVWTKVAGFDKTSRQAVGGRFLLGETYYSRININFRSKATTFEAMCFDGKC